jgi:hypothetical protein
MPIDNNASISSWRRRFRLSERELFPLVVLALLCAALVAFVAYTTFRLRVTYAVQTEVATMRAERRNIVAENDREHDALVARLDELERVLFGEVLGKITDQLKQAKPPITAVQVWQRNRDRELRDRLARLEQWRLELEAKK